MTEANDRCVPSIIAVHGLASNPETTWLGRRKQSAPTAADSDAVSQPDNTISNKWNQWLRYLWGWGRPVRPSKHDLLDGRPNWLRDFLPKDLPARVMAYHHDSRWQRNSLSMSLEDHAMNLLLAIRNKRKNHEVDKKNYNCIYYILINDPRKTALSFSSATVSAA